MKKRIGWLNNKPIIQGDKNLKNSNELHIDELSSNNSDEGSNNNELFYYKVDEGLDTETLLSLGLFTPIVVIGSPMADVDEAVIIPCSLPLYLQIPYNDGRYLKYIVTSNDTVFIPDVMNPINGKNIMLKGSIEDRLQMLDTTMETAYPTIIRITKEEYENSITDKSPLI